MGRREGGGGEPSPMNYSGDTSPPLNPLPSILETDSNTLFKWLSLNIFTSSSAKSKSIGDTYFVEDTRFFFYKNTENGARLDVLGIKVSEP